MNRTLKKLKLDKWYHQETLRKFFKDYEIELITQKDSSDKEFLFVRFKLLWHEHIFIMHPKHKRLRKVCDEAFNEVGYTS